MPGKLYGIGVGPGDPELITLKAKRLLNEVQCIAVPKTASDRESTALSITEGILDHSKEVLELLFPMSFDEQTLSKSWEKAVSAIRARLDENKDVAFITLGDPTVYSTYMYIHKTIRSLEYQAEIIPGITSFCASAASVGISLGENKETIAIVPSAYECENLTQVLDSFDNIVLMKVAGNLPGIKDKLSGRGLTDKAVLVSKCGFEDEQIEFDIEKAMQSKLSYFTTMIIKRNGVR